MEVFLDCCHSGTGLREIGLTPPPELAPENLTLNRYLSPPADIFLRFNGEEDDLAQKRFIGGNRNRKKKQHILWAGCAANQTSADAFIDDRYHGAFTYYLNVHLRRDPTVPRKELLRKVRATLKHNGYSQIPQIEMDATKGGRSAFVDEKAGKASSRSR